MGTNYYVQDKEPCRDCKREYERLHLGKSSMGWKFAFAAYEGLGLTSAKAWWDYIEKTKARVWDEYGRPEDDLESLKRFIESKQEGLWEMSDPDRGRYGPYASHGRESREYLDSEGYRFIKNPDFS